MNRAVEAIIQPQIVLLGESTFDLDLMHIVVEGDIFCTIQGDKIIDAIIALLATFYIFNISYTNCKQILAFLEETLLGSSRGQNFISVNTLINVLF